MAKVDFVLQLEDKVVPVEVKAGINLRAKSLKIYQERYRPAIAIQTSLADFAVADNLYDIPLYLLESLDTLITRKAAP